jgi:hypothetical protein
MITLLRRLIKSIHSCFYACFYTYDYDFGFIKMHGSAAGASVHKTPSAFLKRHNPPVLLSLCCFPYYFPYCSPFCVFPEKEKAFP